MPRRGFESPKKIRFSPILSGSHNYSRVVGCSSGLHKALGGPLGMPAGRLAAGSTLGKCPAFLLRQHACRSSKLIGSRWGAWNPVNGNTAEGGHRAAAQVYGVR